MTLRLFRVYRTDETRLDTDGDVLGWGVQFPSGHCYIDWHLEIFPEEDRLDAAHVSQYGTLADVAQGSGGEVVIEAEFPEWGPGDAGTSDRAEE